MVISQLESKLARRPYSPLFARLASEYFNAGQIEEAKELCISGLQQYPFYATAHFVLAKCYATGKNYSMAEKHLQQVLVRLPACSLLHRFHEEWQTVTNEPRTELPEIFNDTETSLSSPDEYLTSSQDIQKPVSDEEPNELQTQPIITESQSPPALTTQPIPTIDIKSTDELTNPIYPKDPTPANRPDNVEKRVYATEEGIFRANEEGRIVSKTLAEIYAMQGEYHEAILTYQLLKRQRPHQSHEFDNRINELKALHQSKVIQ